MNIAKELERRDEALRTLDMDYGRSILPGVPDEVVLLGMHKARYELQTLSREIRMESARFLREGGWVRMTGEPLLPEGELPE